RDKLVSFGIVGELRFVERGRAGGEFFDRLGLRIEREEFAELESFAFLPTVEPAAADQQHAFPGRIVANRSAKRGARRRTLFGLAPSAGSEIQNPKLAVGGGINERADVGQYAIASSSRLGGYGCDLIWDQRFVVK